MAAERCMKFPSFLLANSDSESEMDYLVHEHPRMEPLLQVSNVRSSS